MGREAIVWLDKMDNVDPLMVLQTGKCRCKVVLVTDCWMFPCRVCFRV